MKKLFPLILFIFLSFFACKEKKQSSSAEVPDKTTYKAVLKEIILANVIGEQLKRQDSTAGKKLLGLVYKKYKIDSLEFKKTTDYYSNEPAILEEIYQEINDEFKHQTDSLQKLVSPEKLKTDSIELPKELLQHKLKYDKKN